MLAGKEYGSGSSRDWAAKGTKLLGVRAVIAESYERIHRSNLVGMGVLPLQFKPGETAETLGLTGEEVFEIAGMADALKKVGSGKVHMTVKADLKEFEVLLRIDTPQEVLYYQHGGILPYVLRSSWGSRTETPRETWIRSNPSRQSEPCGSTTHFSRESWITFQHSGHVTRMSSNGSSFSFSVRGWAISGLDASTSL